MKFFTKQPSIRTLLNQILASQIRLEKTMSTTNTALATLQAQVTQNETIEESAVTLITGLAAQIAAAGTDPVALKALSDGLNKSATDLAAAITANTPAAPTS
jgi:predicted  nucleic acid-binding Zn-ribbon protein